MSTNKTQNYQLHTWEADDDFLRTEFNENFAKLDGAIHNILVTGTYTGDGEDQKIISLGFTPRVVLLLSASGEASYTTYIRGGLAFPETPAQYSGQEVLAIVNGGFRVNNNVTKYVDIGTNSKSRVFHYLALR